MTLDSRSARRLEDLLDAILTWDMGMPVRPMEQVLELGPDAVPAIVEALEDVAGASDLWEPLEDDGGVLDIEAAFEEHAAELDAFYDVETLWLLVLLGQTGDPQAVKPLLEWVGNAEAGPSHRHVASEGLARIGEPALAALAERLDDGAPEDERLWLYAALGAMRTVEPAHDRLVESLETDPELIDVVATALVQWRRREDVPRLAEALARCEPWQRFEVEEAIRTLHYELDDGPAPDDRDWRLRYRIHPVWRTVEPSWAIVAALMRQEGMEEEREGMPVRSLEEILAEPPSPDEETRYCEECGEPLERPTGVWICPDTAVAVPLMQHDFLGEMRVEEGVEDLFDLLDVVEADEVELRTRTPRSRRSRERRETEMEELQLVRATCRWAIGEGIEDVGAARARLLVEALRLRDIYGDPGGYLAERPVPERREAEPGRNDPCPCGSGRKYKKCCGRPGSRPRGREQAIS